MSTPSNVSNRHNETPDPNNNPENIVFVFPHQDDEMMTFHRIRHLLKQKRQLYMVWVTDGAANSDEVRKSLVIRLTLPLLARARDEAIRKLRKRESTSLMRRLGIPDRNLRFLSFPSGQTKNCFPQIVKSLEEVFLKLNPREIYTTAYDNGGFEHDICNAAVKFASRSLREVTLYEYPVVNVYKSFLHTHWLIPFQGSTVHHTPFTRREELERFRLFRTIYRSQWCAAYLEKILSFFPSEYGRLGEPYRIMPDYDYSKQITSARLSYRPRSLTFKDFQDIVSEYIK
jgi:LmbE family N-acetylglucosaminyl deacetylase